MPTLQLNRKRIMSWPCEQLIGCLINSQKLNECRRLHWYFNLWCSTNRKCLIFIYHTLNIWHKPLTYKWLLYVIIFHILWINYGSCCCFCLFFCFFFHFVLMWMDFMTDVRYLTVKDWGNKCSLGVLSVRRSHCLRWRWRGSLTHDAFKGQLHVTDRTNKIEHVH